jgi:hypothetical protein
MHKERVTKQEHELITENTRDQAPVLASYRLKRFAMQCLKAHQYSSISEFDELQRLFSREVSMTGMTSVIDSTVF